MSIERFFLSDKKEDGMASTQELSPKVKLPAVMVLLIVNLR